MALPCKILFSSKLDIQLVRSSVLIKGNTNFSAQIKKNQLYFYAGKYGVREPNSGALSGDEQVCCR